jgi:hypothetical protein
LLHAGSRKIEERFHCRAVSLVSARALVLSRPADQAGAGVPAGNG